MRDILGIVWLVVCIVAVGMSWHYRGRQDGIEIGRAMERCEASDDVYLREAVEVRDLRLVPRVPAPPPPPGPKRG